MSKWKEVQDNYIQQIAEKHRVDKSIIDSLVSEWQRILFVNEEWDNVKYEPSGKEVVIRTIDLAKLSILYHENIEAFESEDPNVFLRSVLTKQDTELKSLKLSSATTNWIIKTYLQKLKKSNQLLSKDEAHRVIRQLEGRPNQYRPTDIYSMYINTAIEFLKVERVTHYASIISELLSLMGIAEIKPGAIRRHAGRLSSIH